MLNKGKKKAPVKQEELFKVRLLQDESIRRLYTQRVKLHLNTAKKNEMDIEEEWKNLQNILKSAVHESLGTIKGRNKRKYLKIWDNQIKQLIETKKKSYKKMVEFKETRGQTGIQKKYSTGQKRSKKKTLSWDKFVTDLEHNTYRTQPKVYKILKRISKDVKETARIQGNMDENVFLQCYEKLWNITNINELQLEHNSADHLNTFITLGNLEEALKLTKNGKPPDNITLT